MDGTDDSPRETQIRLPDGAELELSHEKATRGIRIRFDCERALWEIWISHRNAKRKRVWARAFHVSALE